MPSSFRSTFSPGLHRNLRDRDDSEWASVSGGNSLLPTVVRGPRAPAAPRTDSLRSRRSPSTLFGVISPVLVGLLSDHVFGPANGLRMASLSVAFPAVVIGATIYWLADEAYRPNDCTGAHASEQHDTGFRVALGDHRR